MSINLDIPSISEQHLLTKHFLKTTNRSANCNSSNSVTASKNLSFSVFRSTVIKAFNHLGATGAEQLEELAELSRDADHEQRHHDGCQVHRRLPVRLL